MCLRSGIQDPRSGKKPIPDPGSRGQKGTGFRIRNTVAKFILDHADRLQYADFFCNSLSVFWPSVTVLNLLEVILLFRIGNLSNDLSFIA
jgi:hypothetical protein